MFQVDQLIIIGGPSCAGKTFLINKIQQSGSPRLRETLDITNPSLWHYTSINELKHIRQPIIERMIVHCDLYSQYSKENGFNHLHELITKAGRLVILTLYVPDKVLINRMDSRLLESLSDLILNSGIKLRLKALRRIKRRWKKRRSYKNGFGNFLYERWFNFLIQSNLTNHRQLVFNKSDIEIVCPDMSSKVEMFTDANVNNTMDNCQSTMPIAISLKLNVTG